MDYSLLESKLEIPVTIKNFKEYTDIIIREDFIDVFRECLKSQNSTLFTKRLTLVNFVHVEIDKEGFLVILNG